MGFQAMCDRWFQGDRKAATEWLVKKGQFVTDTPYRADGLGKFRDPGPHPAHRAQSDFQLENVQPISF